jgi:hypothetical protein
VPGTTGDGQAGAGQGSSGGTPGEDGHPGGGQPGGNTGSGGQPGSNTGSGGQPGSNTGSGGQPGSNTGSGGQPGSNTGSGGQPGSNTGSGGSGGAASTKPVILLGGPSAENRNPSTAWPDILVYSQEKRSGCGEMHNGQDVDIPATVVDVAISGSQFSLTENWAGCRAEGYSASAAEGCTGVVLQPGPLNQSNGCLVSVRAPFVSGEETPTATLRLTLRALCTSLEGPPCQRLVELQAGHSPSTSAPVTVEWVSETVLTARPAQGAVNDTDNGHEAQPGSDGGGVAPPGNERQNDVAPNGGDVVPNGDDVVRNGGDVVPNSDDAVRNGGEAVPNSDDAVPNSDDAVPNSDDAVPNSADAVPSRPEN